MAGRSRRTPRSSRLATPQQLYVLNRAGRLKLVLEDDADEPAIWNSEADAAIKRSMARSSSSPLDGSGEEEAEPDG